MLSYSNHDCTNSDRSLWIHTRYRVTLPLIWEFHRQDESINIFEETARQTDRQTDGHTEIQRGVDIQVDRREREREREREKIKYSELNRVNNNSHLLDPQAGHELRTNLVRMKFFHDDTSHCLRQYVRQISTSHSAFLSTRNETPRALRAHGVPVFSVHGSIFLRKTSYSVDILYLLYLPSIHN